MIGEFLRQERNKQNLSQKALADKCGISFVTINKIEHGRGARIQILDKVFAALGKKVVMSVEDLEQAPVEEVVF